MKALRIFSIVDDLSFVRGFHLGIISVLKEAVYKIPDLLTQIDEYRYA